MKIEATMLASDIIGELGYRIKKIRLSRKIKQDSLAREAGIGTSTLKRLEAGNDVSLESFIKILQALDLAQNLELTLPEHRPGPIEQLDQAGNERQRAPSSSKSDGDDDWSWGDDE